MRKVQICGCSGWVSIVTSKERICWLSHCVGNVYWRRNKIEFVVYWMVIAEKGHCPITLCPASCSSEMAVKEEWASGSQPSLLPTGQKLHEASPSCAQALPDAPVALRQGCGCCTDPEHSANEAELKQGTGRAGRAASEWAQRVRGFSSHAKWQPAAVPSASPKVLRGFSS